MHRIVWLPNPEAGFAPPSFAFNEDGTPHDQPLLGHGRMKFRLPDGTIGSTGECRSCPETIIWIKTPAGKAAPYNPDGTSHFATCPGSSRWKGRTRAEGPAL